MDRTPFGALLETFVVGELMKVASWHGGRFEFSHFRDEEGSEVDVVIEDRQGRVVGIEVKAAATVTGSDFGGLRKGSADRGLRSAPFSAARKAGPGSTSAARFVLV